MIREISPRLIARIVAALILISGFSILRIFLAQAFSPGSYASSTGLISLAISLPLLLPLVGAAALFTTKRFGYALIYAGFLWTIFTSSGWVYLPFVSLPFDSPIVAAATLLAVNGVLVGILLWCHLAERKSSKSPYKASLNSTTPAAQAASDGSNRRAD